MAPADAEHDVAHLLRHVATMLARGRPGAARPLLNAVLRDLPAAPETMELEARLLESEGRPGEAMAVLDRAVAGFPRSVLARLSRAGARAKAGDPAGAAADAAEAVCLDPRLPRAKALLGAALLELGRLDDALACLREAVAAEPAVAGYRQALARAQELHGEVDAAARSLADGTALRPDHIGLRTAAILLLIRHGRFAGAEALAEAARRDGVVDASVFGLLGHARSSLGRHAEAADAYEEARKLSAEDPYVRHLVAAAGLSPVASKAAPAYVVAVFDGYAPRFDAHLIGLGYRIPGLIRRELQTVAPLAGPVLDLGCGTGLIAVAAADLFDGPLIGVDLSERMLAEAKRRNLYAELHHTDIEAFLASDSRQYACVLAGDVMPYFGDLRPLLRAVAERMLPGGRLMLSLEALPADQDHLDGWRLGRLGRYAHTPHHVTTAAAVAGLTTAAMRTETVRMEAGAPVAGLFVVLAREAV